MAIILLVEDDKSLREIYGVRLLAEGYDIVSAGDGEEALAMAIKDRPDLILSDVMMPKISGFDMLDILRSTTETRDIKVIMMTALSSEDQRQRGEQLGADRYLVKSQVGIEDVVRTVHEVLADAPVAASTTNAFAPPTPSAVAAPAPDEPTTSPVVAAEPIAATPAAVAVDPVVPPSVVSPAAAVGPLAMTTPLAAASSSAPSVNIAAPTPDPVAPPIAAANPDPATASSDTSTLPQPTAPFSTGRPTTLGERVIQPIEKPVEEGPHISELIDQELGTGEPASEPPLSTPPAVPTEVISPTTLSPQPTPLMPPMPLTPPAPPTLPTPASPVMEPAPLHYEETPISNSVQSPSTQQPPASL